MTPATTPNSKKRCAKCGKRRRLKFFNPERKRNRLHSYCKSCSHTTVAAWKKEHPERVKHWTKTYIDARREFLSFKQFVRYWMDPEKARAYYRDRYHAKRALTASQKSSNLADPMEAVCTNS